MQLRVMMSPGPAISNPYVRMLIEHLPDDVTVAWFSWRRALRGDFDVLHVHWPEALVVSGGRVRGLAVRVLFASLLVSLRVRHKPSIATIHNRKPHESLSGSARWLVERFLSRSTRRIYLTRSALEEANDRAGVHIDHGDYAPVVAMESASIVEARVGRLVLFGRVRPYKGVEDLLRAFSGIEDPIATLLIAGRPLDDRYGQELVGVTDDPRVEFSLRSLPESDLVGAVTGSEIAVFPYRDIYNSGAVLYALSFGRPVIATRSASTVELQDEIGSQWLELIDYPATSDQLASALSGLRGSADSRRNVPLTNRGWDAISRRHAEVYRETAQS